MTSQLGVSNAISTPRRLAISVPTSMSKPWYSPSAVSSDCGGYCGSVDILIVPACRTLSSRPPGIGDAGASLAGASLASASLAGASLMAGSLAAGGSLASGALEPPAPLLVHAPTAIAATASRTIERRPRRQATASMYSSMTHRSRPMRWSCPRRDVRSNAAQCRRNPRDARILPTIGRGQAGGAWRCARNNIRAESRRSLTEKPCDPCTDVAS